MTAGGSHGLEHGVYHEGGYTYCRQSRCTAHVRCVRIAEFPSTCTVLPGTRALPGGPHKYLDTVHTSRQRSSDVLAHAPLSLQTECDWWPSGSLCCAERWIRSRPASTTTSMLRSLSRNVSRNLRLPVRPQDRGEIVRASSAEELPLTLRSCSRETTSRRPISCRPWSQADRYSAATRPSLRAR